MAFFRRNAKVAESARPDIPGIDYNFLATLGKREFRKDMVKIIGTGLGVLALTAAIEFTPWGQEYVADPLCKVDQAVLDKTAPAANTTSEFLLGVNLEQLVHPDLVGSRDLIEQETEGAMYATFVPVSHGH